MTLATTALVELTQVKAYLQKDEVASLEAVAEYVGMGDGSDVTFSLDHTPVAGSLKLYVNGSLQTEVTHFTLSGANITFVAAPTLNYPITADYQYAASADTMESYDDALLEYMIAAATQLAEDYTGRAFIQREITETYQGYGQGVLKLRKQPISTVSTVSYRKIVNNTGDGATVAFSLGETPKANSLSVYVDDVLKTVTTDYTLSGSTVTFLTAPADDAKLIFRFDVRLYLNGAYFEQLSSGRLKGAWLTDYEYTVVYTAGYSTTRATAQASIPNAVMGVLITVANWYENRLGLSQESTSGIGSVAYQNAGWILPDTAKAVLNTLRIGWLF